MVSFSISKINEDTDSISVKTSSGLAINNVLRKVLPFLCTSAYHPHINLCLVVNVVYNPHNVDNSMEPHIQDLGEVLGTDLRLKFMDQIFNLFDIEKSMEMYLHYSQPIHNLLAIASWIYFNTLSLEEKLALLNTPYTIDDLIDFIIKNNIDVGDGQQIVKSLNSEGYPRQALKFMSFIRKTPMYDYIDKTGFFISLAYTHFELKNYEKCVRIGQAIINDLNDNLPLDNIILASSIP